MVSTLVAEGLERMFLAWLLVVEKVLSRQRAWAWSFATVRRRMVLLVILALGVEEFLVQ